MIALKTPSDCALFAQIVDPYIDGELEPGHAASVEVHTRACHECKERVELARALKKSLKRTAPSKAQPVPERLRQNVAAAIASSIANTGRGKEQPRRDGEPSREAGGLPRKSAMAAAALAGFLCAMGVSALRETEAETKRAAGERDEPSVHAAASLEKVLDDLVALHRRPPRPETINPEEIARFDVEVGVPVRRPALPFEARFMGARLYATEKARAVQLQYAVKKGNRVSLYVFDPSVLRLANAAGLRRRAQPDADGTPVFVGERDGYSIAAAERSGIGIALATDLDREDSAAIALAALRQ
jgi:anti-sigma factor RsiW